MSAPRFPLTWIAPGIPGIRECNSTYCETPLAGLPAVEAAGDLAWLTPLHPVIDAEMEQYRPSASERQTYAQKAAAILTQAEDLGLSLPAAFKKLVKSAELQDRFPSATACYFDLPEKIVAAPFGLDGHIIRFLNDQQVCVLWYLHMPARGEPSVLASYSTERTMFLELLDTGDAEAAANAFRATHIAAPTLQEFLYRYWIENSIYFKKSRGIELTFAEIAYVSNFLL